MWAILKSLLSGVARGLRWSLGLACDIVQAPFVAAWRQICPPPAQEAETGAEIAERVVEAMLGTKDAAARRAETERPAPRQPSQAAIRRGLETALAYTGAIMRGETPPSLAHVPAALCHELRSIRTRADAEPMHREIMSALGIEADGWDRPETARDILAPAHDHQETPRLRYA